MSEYTPSGELTPEIRKQLFQIAAGSRTRQNHYLPEWEPDQTYGKLQPGHTLNMAAIQHHMADLIVLTDWMPKVLAALEELEACRHIVSVVVDVEACLQSEVEVPEFMLKTLTDRLNDLDSVREEDECSPT